MKLIVIDQILCMVKFNKNMKPTFSKKIVNVIIKIYYLIIKTIKRMFKTDYIKNMNYRLLPKRL